MEERVVYVVYYYDNYRGRAKGEDTALSLVCNGGVLRVGLFF